MVLVDTPVWSLALRRKRRDLSPAQSALTEALTELIRDGRAQLVGMVRQELLSGIRGADRFAKLRDYLRAFDEPQLESLDYERAAEMHNRCRTRGIAGPAIDFLICAIADRRHWTIFTGDRNFKAYSRVLEVKLYRDV